MAIQVVNTFAFHVRRLSTGAGEQVYVSAIDLPGARAVLAAQYGADLGKVSGGAPLVFAALTTMTGT
jgi:hypothetical protein